MMEMQLQITPGLRTENTQPASTCSNLSRVHCSVMVSPSPASGRWESLGNYTFNAVSTLYELRMDANLAESCLNITFAWRNLQVFQILIERCYIIHSCFNWGVSCQILFLRKSSWDEMSETCKPGDAIKIWLDARFARSWQRSLVIAEAGVQVLESGSSRS